MSPTAPTFGIALPQIEPGPDPAGRIRAVVRVAEQAGFDMAWTQEDTLRAKGTLEPLTVLSFAAASSERLRLGLAVAIAPLHLPVQLAKTAATVDVLSGGRLVLGLGLGGDVSPYPAFGLPAAGRARRLDEMVGVLRALWTGAPVQHAGEFFRLDGQAMTPVPAQRPSVPIWFGGHGPGALRRTAALGDGFIGAGSSSSAAFAEQVATIRALRAEGAGGDRPFTVAKRVYLACDPDGRRARERLHAWLRWYYDFDPRIADTVGVAGTVDDCVEGVQQVLDAGAEHVLLNFVFDEERSIEIAAAEILPRLRR